MHHTTNDFNINTTANDPATAPMSQNHQYDGKSNSNKELVPN